MRAVLTRPAFWPVVIRRIAATCLIRLRAPRFFVPRDPQVDDIETSLYRDRANGMLLRLADGHNEDAVAEFNTLMRKPLVADDPYSCSQRVAHAAYLIRLLGEQCISPFAWPNLERDVAVVIKHPEFRLRNDWFNNHLLNNFRALALARTQTARLSSARDLDQSLQRLDNILVRHADTLFSGGRGPILAEGSLSYELLCLRHLVDICCCGIATRFVSLAREWMRETASSYVARLRWRDRWIIPAVGDHSPDWTGRDIEIFLDGVFLGKPTVYRSIWSRELAGLGLELIGMEKAHR